MAINAGITSGFTTFSYVVDAMRGRTNNEKNYNKELLNHLKDTNYFTENAIEHIFEGQVNARGKAVGYHYEYIEKTAGRVIDGTESLANAFGVYQAQVEVNGITKNVCNGYCSSIFPKEMNPQEVIDNINYAYINRVYIRGNRYRGIGKNGIKIEMFLDSNEKLFQHFLFYN